MPSGHPIVVTKKTGAASPSHQSSSSSRSFTYTAKALADQITALPGLSEPISFDQFAGYLDVSATKKVFYW